jgi:DNA primase
LSVGVAAEIKSKLDLAEIIGESVSLRKAGTAFKGLCPFHGEKTPSFTVTPARESWKCFGCGKGGDLFSFVMERDSIDFPEALRRLAARAGVELDERSSREDARRKRLRDVLEQAIAFYHQVLTGTKHGQPALDYLRGRGFTDATIETHQLGWSLDAWDQLATRLAQKRQVREDELLDTGLAKRSQRRRGVYDTFRARIIFPIRDASGSPTGLGGRILGAEGTDAQGRPTGPKYLHTSTTPLFDKSRTLYLIDKAKGAIRKSGRAVIVEGNTDALMAHQAGFENVVCSMGTALTPGQVELVTRYAPEIALAYDVDAAGQSAATFGATELSALVSEIERSPHRGRLTEVGVVRLPAGKDPDEVIRDEPATWREAAEHPQPIMEYLIDRFAARHDPRTLQGRERLVNAVMPTLRTITDPVRRDGYLQLLARRSGVDERVLLESLRQTDSPLGGVPRPRGQGSGGAGAVDHGGRRIDLDALLSTPGALDPEAVRRTLEPVESTLLRLVLVHPERQERIRTRLKVDDLATTPARELWRAILAHRGPDGERPFDRNAFLDALEPTLEAIARTLYAATDPTPETDDELDGAIADCLLRLRRRKLDELFDYKRAELVEAEAAADEAATDRIRREIAGLRQERADLDILKNENSLLHRRPRPERADRPDTTRTPTHAGGIA